jgi:arsenate reductase
MACTPRIGPGKGVDPLALVALKEMGIDTNALSPKLLTREIAKRADRIVTMGCPEACPAVGKTMEDWRIEDTSGKDIEDHRKVREIIGGKVERLLRAPGSGQAGNAADEGKRRAAT